MTVYNKASLVLAESPAYKAGTIQPHYPLTPDVSFDFTRATSATRVNADGNIEKETQNLLLQSNQFDTTWSLLNSQVTSGQSGYDSSSDAWLLERSGSGANVFIRSTTIAASGVCTISIYAKAGNSNWLAIQDSGSSNVLCYFDLSNGTLGFASPAIIDKQITSVGNGWYRCSITTNRSSGLVQFYVATANQTLSGASDAALYIQDAQLEQGLVARDYQETTTSAFYGGITDNVPRLDYTDSSCPSVLLEPQRTNLMIHSEYINSPHYGKSAGITLTNNYSDSPEGVKNSTRVQSADGNQYLLESFTLDANKTYVFTCYVKGTSGERVRQYVDGNGLPTGFVYEDILLDGTWQRNDLIINTDSEGGSVNPHLLFGYGVANPARDIETWGWQLEEGSYATSYIPTYGTSVTRNEDANVKITNQASLIGQTEGTLFLDINPLEFASSSRYLSIESSSGGGSGWIGIFGSSPDEFRIYGDGFDVNIAGYSAGNRAKIALTYKNGQSTNIYINGINKSSITANTTGKNYSILKLGDAIIGGIGAGKYNQSLLFPTALTDDECIALTTL